jgi:hypothetical protein
VDGRDSKHQEARDECTVRNSQFVLFAVCYQGAQTEQDKTDRACGTYGRGETATEF